MMGVKNPMTAIVLPVIWPLLRLISLNALMLKIGHKIGPNRLAKLQHIAAPSDMSFKKPLAPANQ